MYRSNHNQQARREGKVQWGAGRAQGALLSGAPRNSIASESGDELKSRRKGLARRPSGLRNRRFCQVLSPRSGVNYVGVGGGCSGCGGVLGFAGAGDGGGGGGAVSAWWRRCRTELFSASSGSANQEEWFKEERECDLVFPLVSRANTGPVGARFRQSTGLPSALRGTVSRTTSAEYTPLCSFSPPRLEIKTGSCGRVGFSVLRIRRKTSGAPCSSGRNWLRGRGRFAPVQVERVSFCSWKRATGFTWASMRVAWPGRRKEGISAGQGEREVETRLR